MGTLVALPIRPTLPRAIDPDHSAAILFFTGVRYYRMDGVEAPACPATPAYATRRGRRRKAPPAELLA